MTQIYYIYYNIISIDINAWYISSYRVHLNKKIIRTALIDDFNESRLIIFQLKNIENL